MMQVQTIQLNLRDLVALAGGKGPKDDLSAYDQLPSNLKEALAEEMKDQAKEVAKKSAKEILKLIQVTDSVMSDSVDRIRELRRQVEAEKAKLTQLGEAKTHALESNNFIPLMNTLGLLSQRDLQSIDPKLTVVAAKRTSKKD